MSPSAIVPLPPFVEPRRPRSTLTRRRRGEYPTNVLLTPVDFAETEASRDERGSNGLRRLPRLISKAGIDSPQCFVIRIGIMDSGTTGIMIATFACR